jgi:hypothetical protein
MKYASVVVLLTSDCFLEIFRINAPPCKYDVN